MKKIYAIILVLVLSLTASATAYMDTQKVAVTLNGTALTFDVEPFIENDRTLVPMRAIFEAVGAQVAWDEETQTVFAVRTDNDGKTSIVSLQINSDKAFTNDKKTTLEVPAKIVDDRTFVPLRFVIESLGEKVEWNGETYTVSIVTE